MKIRNRLRHAGMILTLCAIGVAETYYLPRYRIELFLASIMATVFLAGSWMRSRLD